MTEKVGKTVCEGTVADLMKDKTGKQTVITLTKKNAYRVKKIREQGTDDEAVLFHFRKRCTGMGSYVHTIEMHIPADTRSAFPVISVHSQVSIQCRWQS